MSNLTGQILAQRYRVGRLLGRGGMGAVYEAYEEPLKRSVAIKVMNAHGASEDSVARFVREGQIAANLGSPHVAHVHALHRNPGEPMFIAMELLAGESLQQRLRTRLLTEDEAIEIGSQTLSLLTLAHDQGVVHRDIKPANLQLVPDATLGVLVKVLDFGIAKLAFASQVITRDEFMLGTVTYMAPEQIFGRDVDGRADLYALASTLLIAMTGAQPGPALSIGERIHLLESRGEYPEMTGLVAPRIGSILRSALAKTPANRPPSARAMLQAFQTAAPNMMKRGSAVTRAEHGSVQPPPAATPPVLGPATATQKDPSRASQHQQTASQPAPFPPQQHTAQQPPGQHPPGLHHVAHQQTAPSTPQPMPLGAPQHARAGGKSVALALLGVTVVGGLVAGGVAVGLHVGGTKEVPTSRDGAATTTVAPSGAGAPRLLTSASQSARASAAAIVPPALGSKAKLQSSADAGQDVLKSDAGVAAGKCLCVAYRDRQVNGTYPPEGNSSLVLRYTRAVCHCNYDPADHLSGGCPAAPPAAAACPKADTCMTWFNKCNRNVPNTKFGDACSTYTPEGKQVSGTYRNCSAQGERHVYPGPQGAPCKGYHSDGILREGFTSCD
jgi:eukaryotic-like serine/threonine-protein kinase